MLDYLRRAAGLVSNRRDEHGATATEYGLLVGFIAMVIVISVAAFGNSLADYYTVMADWVTATLL